MHERSCYITVELKPQMLSQLGQLRRSNSLAKQRILFFVSELINEGFCHFYICVNSQSDYWLAEMLFFLQMNDCSLLKYSLVFIENEIDRNDGIWQDDEPHWKDVLQGAQSVIYKKEDWYEELNKTVYISFWNE